MRISNISTAVHLKGKRNSVIAVFELGNIFDADSVDMNVPTVVLIVMNEYAYVS